MQALHHCPFPIIQRAALLNNCRGFTRGRVKHIWLRSETKPGELRAPLTPIECSKLVAAGYKVTVEESTLRCIPAKAYADVGCEIMPEHSWREAPPKTVIFGLKEIDGDFDLSHRHICFFHCFKKQIGWHDSMMRFARGGGALWDLENLEHTNGRRVAAFGVPAGQMGTLVGVEAWCQQQFDPTKSMPPATPFESLQDSFVKLRELVKCACAQKPGSKPPRVLVIGALGRCGSGAVQVAKECGLEVTSWDMAETSGGGPFAELLRYEIVVNCILLTQEAKPFLTKEMLENSPDRKLTVLSDVSCDYTSPYHPFPFYYEGTTLEKPTLRVHASGTGEPLIDVVSIDNLPTLIPKEASANYAEQLLPPLLNLKNSDSDPVWTNAADVFRNVLSETLEVSE